MQVIESLNIITDLRYILTRIIIIAYSAIIEIIILCTMWSRGHSLILISLIAASLINLLDLLNLL